MSQDVHAHEARYYQMLEKLTGVDYRALEKDAAEQPIERRYAHLIEMRLFTAPVSSAPLAVVVAPAGTTVDSLAFACLDAVGFDDSRAGWYMVLPFGVPGRRRVTPRTKRVGPVGSDLYVNALLWNDPDLREWVSQQRPRSRGEMWPAETTSFDSWRPRDEVYWRFDTGGDEWLFRLKSQPVDWVTQYSYRDELNRVLGEPAGAQRGPRLVCCPTPAPWQF